MRKYDTICANCGGLIADPVKVYGWGGTFCHCPDQAFYIASNYVQSFGVGDTFAFWCVKKHIIPTGAVYLYKGNSLCSEHFNKKK